MLISTPNPKPFYSLTHLAVLTVSGNDAATLLQGQITCDVRTITENQASLGGLCNPKGQVISTFLLLKNHDDFLLVLPKALLETVQARLQRVVLRSKVKIDSGTLWQVIGSDEKPSIAETAFACQQTENSLKVTFFGRYLLLTQTQQHFQIANVTDWLYADMVAGMPWLSIETSEEFIAQQLNLDKLGAISFNKGCYIGQEIIARTHYLGKVKRGLYVGECGAANALEIGSIVVNAQQQAMGKIIAAQTHGDVCCVQLVLQHSEDETDTVYVQETNLPIQIKNT